MAQIKRLPATIINLLLSAIMNLYRKSVMFHHFASDEGKTAVGEEYHDWDNGELYLMCEQLLAARETNLQI